MKLETVAIESLTLDPNNARKHSQRNLDAIGESLTKFGQRKPIVVHKDVVLAGNGTIEAAKSLGWTEITISRCPADWDNDTAKAYALADNRSSELAEWDDAILATQLLDLDEMGWDIEAIGFEPLPLRDLDESKEDEIPELEKEAISKIGDIWQLGNHRVMCGDSTNKDHVAALMNGKIADLIHADPPYGMGKEKNGVENDNLYADKLDSFQILWFKTLRKYVADNAGVYIWGNPEDLWRLWFNGLKQVERMTFRNEIVWSKPVGFGQNSELTRSYAVNTERCLFIMLGEQGFNNNSDNYWNGWESIRFYLESEVAKCGWSMKEVNAICGVTSMATHWLTKSQWTFIIEKYYLLLQEAAKPYDALKKDYDALKKDYDALKKDYDALKKDFYSTRAYFDNTHDNMNEVWSFDRVYGEERQGHATPKPVEMMARVMKSSLPVGGLCVEPFGGSGSTLIGAEQTGRICYTMELTPLYVDVIVKRWENLTGQKAELIP